MLKVHSDGVQLQMTGQSFQAEWLQLQRKLTSPSYPIPSSVISMKLTPSLIAGMQCQQNIHSYRNYWFAGESILLRVYSHKVIHHV